MGGNHPVGIYGEELCGAVSGYGFLAQRGPDPGYLCGVGVHLHHTAAGRHVRGDHVCALAWKIYSVHLHDTLRASGRDFVHQYRLPLFRYGDISVQPDDDAVRGVQHYGAALHLSGNPEQSKCHQQQNAGGRGPDAGSRQTLRLLPGGDSQHHAGGDCLVPAGGQHCVR